MDKFITITKSTSLRAPKDDKKRVLKYSPYDVKDKTIGGRQSTIRAENKPSSSALTKHLLSTLTEQTNPITHSDISQRTDHVLSVATGHQVADRRPRYLQDRNMKLSDQRKEHGMAAETDGILRNVKVYINGYLRDTTDIEMKRIVTLAGGLVMTSASGASHILTSQQLSGSKTQKILTSKSRKPAYVVQPEWVSDSIKAGRRQPERLYSVIKCASTMDVYL